MNHSQKGLNQRFYDKRPQLSQGVGLMKSFPIEVQVIVANGIIAIADKECRAGEILNSYKSLGQEKVLGLYKAKNKRRDYDDNPTLHKAMTYLFVLSPENQDFIGRWTVELASYLLEYFKACHQYNSEPTEADLLEIRDRFVEKGGTEARQFLKTMQDKFEQRMATMATASPGVAGVQSFQEEAQGLKIRSSDN